MLIAFYLTHVSKLLAFQHATNTKKLLMRHFTLFFFLTKFEIWMVFNLGRLWQLSGMVLFVTKWGKYGCASVCVLLASSG